MPGNRLPLTVRERGGKRSESVPRLGGGHRRTAEYRSATRSTEAPSRSGHGSAGVAGIGAGLGEGGEAQAEGLREFVLLLSHQPPGPTTGPLQLIRLASPPGAAVCQAAAITGQRSAAVMRRGRPSCGACGTRRRRARGQ